MGSWREREVWVFVLSRGEFGGGAQGEAAKRGRGAESHVIIEPLDQGEAGETTEHEFGEGNLGTAQGGLLFPVMAVLADEAAVF